MRPEEIAAIAHAVADGTPVDWQAVEASSVSPAEREMMHNLRIISSLGTVYRTDPRTEQRSKSPPSDVVLSTLPTWGQFALLQRLGGGAQGEVYRALDVKLEREVAVKFLKQPARPSDTTHVLSEARLLARVRHANVAIVYGADLIDGRVGLWMELISGETLHALVRARGPMNALEASLVGLDLCRAVGAVHQAGLLHRDIKAQNVMRENGGRYVLMDFGAGQLLSEEGKTAGAGTPLYLAPEVLDGGAASVRSDIYALGVLLFFLASGDFPVIGETVAAIREAHHAGRRQQLANLRADLPVSFISAIERAIDADPERRPQSAAELSTALAQVIAGETEAHAQPARLRRKPFLFALLLAAATMGGWLWTRPPQPLAGGSVVAVLPFEDLSPSHDVTAVANGLTDLVITDLGQRAPLSVLAQTSSRQFIGSRRMLDLARDLGVTFIVEGSIQHGEGPGDLSVSVRLLRAGSGTLISTRTFAASTARLVALPHEIGEALASVLNASRANRPAMQAQVDPEAMEAYFRGWDEYWRLTREGFVEAERLFQKTTARAPNYAPGFAALAYVTLQLEKSYKAFPPGVGVAAALRSAETSVALDPENAQAQASLGWTKFYGEWKWREGEAALLKSLELNPSGAQARWMYAQLLAAQNRIDAALEEARLAVRLDPLSPSRHSNVATILYYARRYEDAIKESEQILVRDPNAIVGHFGMARFLTALGRHDEALVMLRSSANIKEPPVQAELARILHTAGRTREAAAMLPALEAEYRAGRLAPDYYAFLVLARGDAERALSLLHQAVNERSPSVIWIQVDPRFDSLRSRPEFLDLLRTIGLAS